MAENTPTEDTVQEFIRELNELQRKHGLAIESNPKGLTLCVPGETTVVGYLVTDSFEDGTFKQELYNE